MSVLWWLAVPLGITAVAMVWAAWAGRDRDDRERESDRDKATRVARLGSALAKPLPASARRIVVQPNDRPRGVAVRPSARSTPRRRPGPRR
jgi:hypothetical protein